jgi:hypothetical protein
MINPKFMKLCTLQDPNMKMYTLVVYPDALSFTHIMILNSTKFDGNRTKDVEVGLDRRTDRQTERRTG